MKATTNKKAAGGQPNGFSERTTKMGKSNAKSTATEAQHERILKMLRTGKKSTFDFRRAGIMAPAVRIRELNSLGGYCIPTVALRDLYDDQGYRHQRVAVYELIGEPTNGERS